MTPEDYWPTHKPINQALVFTLLFPLLIGLMVLAFMFPKVFLSMDVIAFMFMMATITIAVVIAKPGLLVPKRRRRGQPMPPALKILPGPKIIVNRGELQKTSPLLLGLINKAGKAPSSPGFELVLHEDHPLSLSEYDEMPQNSRVMAAQQQKKEPNMRVIWALLGISFLFIFSAWVYSMLPAKFASSAPAQMFALTILCAGLFAAAWVAVVPSPEQRQKARQAAGVAKAAAKEVKEVHAKVEAAVVKVDEAVKEAHAAAERGDPEAALAAAEKALAFAKEAHGAAEVAELKAKLAPKVKAAQKAAKEARARADKAVRDARYAKVAAMKALNKFEKDQEAQALAYEQESGEEEEVVEIEEGESLEEVRNRLRPKKPKVPMELLSSANSYDDKVALIRFLVTEDSGRVMKAFQALVKPS